MRKNGQHKHEESSTSSPASHVAHSVHPVPIRQSSTYDTVVSSLSSSLGPLATSSTKTVGAWSRRLSSGLMATAGARTGVSSSTAIDDTASPGPDIDVQADSGEAASAHVSTSAASTSQQSFQAEQAIFSTWDSLSDGRRVLIQVYPNNLVRIWDASNLQEYKEILSSSTVAGGKDGRIVCARVLPGGRLNTVTEAGEPVLVVLTDAGCILLYSLTSHKVIKRVCLAQDTSAYKPVGSATSFSISSKFLVVSHITPPALTVLCLPDFQEVSFSPLLDIPANPYTGEPVYALSSKSGGRMLAYSSTRNLDEGEGNGIIAAQRLSGDGSDPYMNSARKLGGGMISGVRAVSGYGYSKYAEYRDDKGKSSLSKSAPQSRGYLIRQEEEADAAQRRTAPSQLPSSGNDSGKSVQTSVVVLDLVASQRASASVLKTPNLKLVAHFRPSTSHPTVLLSFSPNGTQLLIASSEGHAFHIFELRPTSPITSISSPHSSPKVGKVWHRYRLNRGLTTAQAVSTPWSADGRFVTVNTATGTSHVYAVNPQGGRNGWESHGSEIVKNEQKLAPLSVGVEAVARIKAPKIGHREVVERQEGAGEDMPITAPVSPPEIIFLAKDEAPPTFAYAAHSASSTSKPLSRDVNMLFFYSHTEEVLLSTLVLSSTTSGTSLVGQAVPLAGKAAASAMSGLSKMMRQTTSSSTSAATGITKEEERDQLVVDHERRAYWHLSGVSYSEAKHDRQITVSVSLASAKDSISRTTTPHQAEIVSFSPYPAVLPRSLYLSTLFTWYTYPPGPTNSGQKSHPIMSLFGKGDFASLQSRFKKITVREEVSYLPAEGKSSELQSALYSILDTASPSDSAEEATTSQPAAYPNGFPRIRQSWTSSLASSLPRTLPIPIPVSKAARGALAGLRSPPKNDALNSLSFEENAVLATLPPDYMEPVAIDQDEPVDLFARHRNARTVFNSATGQAPHSLPNRAAPQSFAPSSCTPSSLGVIPELYLDNGSSAEDPREDSPQTRAATSEDDEILQADNTREDEWAGWKLDGIDDEEPPILQAVVPANNSLEPALPPCLPVNIEELPKLLSAASSNSPSPAQPDIISRSASPATSKKKRVKGKKSATPSPSLI